MLISGGVNIYPSESESVLLPTTQQCKRSPSSPKPTVNGKVPAAFIIVRQPVGEAEWRRSA